LRRAAALYAAAHRPAPPAGQEGRPGCPLRRSSPPAATGWTEVAVDERGRTVRRLIWSRQVLRAAVEPDRMLRLAIVRDPTTTHPTTSS